MSRETYALYTGIFILVLGAALVGLARYLGDYGVQREVYLLVSQGSVAGLNPESAVIFRGVPAGKVTAIGFDPIRVSDVLVRIELDPGLPITRGTYGMLRVQALTGLAQVELNDEGEHPEPLSGSRQNPPRLPLRPSVYEKMMASAQDLLPRLTELTTRLGMLADEKNRARVESILGNVDEAAREMIAVEARMNAAMENLPKLREQARRTLEDMARLSRDLIQSSEQIRSLARNTGGLVSSGKTALESLNRVAIPRADSVLTELQRAAAGIQRLSRQLESDPQSLLLGRQPHPPGPGEPGYGENR